MNEEELRKRVADLEAEVAKMKPLYNLSSRVAKMGFGIVEIFREADASLEEVYMTFSHVLGHIHIKG